MCVFSNRIPTPVERRGSHLLRIQCQHYEYLTQFNPILLRETWFAKAIPGGQGRSRTSSPKCLPWGPKENSFLIPSGPLSLGPKLLLSLSEDSTPWGEEHPVVSVLRLVRAEDIQYSFQGDTDTVTITEANRAKLF